MGLNCTVRFETVVCGPYILFSVILLTVVSRFCCYHEVHKYHESSFVFVRGHEAKVFGSHRSNPSISPIESFVKVSNDVNQLKPTASVSSNTETTTVLEAKQCTATNMKTPQLSSSACAIHEDFEGNRLPNTVHWNNKNDKRKRMAKTIQTGSLRPSDLPEPEVFTDWSYLNTSSLSENHTLTLLNGIQLNYAAGSVQQNPLLQGKSVSLSMPFSLDSVGGIGISTTGNIHKRNETIDATFSVLNSLLSRDEVDAILALLRNYEKELDDDPDTVDGMPTFEIFVDNPDMKQQQHQQSQPSSIKYRDFYDLSSRQKLRSDLQKILAPIIEERITPFVQWKYPDLCNKTAPSHNNITMTRRKCYACYSLIRRYRYGERMSHAPHHDGHALVTAVTSLSDYNANYRGGLYVVSPNARTIHNDNFVHDNYKTNYSDFDKAIAYDYKYHNNITSSFRYLGLNAGDTAVHTSALLHGVKVYNKLHQPKTTERWSWILWFRDTRITTTMARSKLEKRRDKFHASDNTKESTNPGSHEDDVTIDKNEESINFCHEDHSNEWFRSCAESGDGICQQLHSTKVDSAREIVYWNMMAAHNGAGTAAVKIGRAYLHELPTESLIPYNVTKAIEYFHLSIQSNNNPEGHYAMAQLYIKQASTTKKSKKPKKPQHHKQQQGQLLQKAIYHLEEAAMAGHVFAMFNLGIAHTYGYGMFDDSSSDDTNYSSPGERINTLVASKWFVESGLPEGYYAASFYFQSVGDTTRQRHYMSRAQTLGYGSQYRVEARKRTGSGGMAAVDINLPWPVSFDGRKPPLF